MRLSAFALNNFKMHTIDLNCDMGESFGAWKMGNDAALMNFVSSVNVACGFHAGDATVIRQTTNDVSSTGVSQQQANQNNNAAGCTSRQSRKSI